MNKKTCTVCHADKPSTAFYGGWDYCRSCALGGKKLSSNERAKHWQKNNPEKFRVGQVVSRAKIRAKERGIPFDLSTADIEIPDVCPVLKIPLSHKRSDGWETFPSLDRIKPELGYVRGNVIVVSMLANTIKSSATPAQVRAVADFYEALCM
jgi:hypothetical protein